MRFQKQGCASGLLFGRALTAEAARRMTKTKGLPDYISSDLLPVWLPAVDAPSQLFAAPTIELR
jgi:hypothetical protein